MQICCTVKNVITVSFVQFNATLLNERLHTVYVLKLIYCIVNTIVYGL